VTGDEDPEGGRALLIQAALDGLAGTDGGAGSVSLRAIARRAGLSHNAATHHFGDRSGLLTAVATVGFRRLERRLQESGERSVAAGQDPLRGFGEAYLTFGLAEPNLLELMFRADLLRTDDPQLQEAQRGAFGALETVMSGEDRAAEAPEDLALVAWAFVHGLVGLARYGALSPPGAGPDTDVRERALHVLEVFGVLLPGPSGRQGLGAGGAAVSAR
jgi:AcrR family transcriptional regulator